VELFVGEKCSDKFRLEFDFHVILEIFYMPQIYWLYMLHKTSTSQFFMLLQSICLKLGFLCHTLWHLNSEETMLH